MATHTDLGEGKPNIRLIWRRHFLGQDFRNCRSMRYGYHVKLTVSAIYFTGDFKTISEKFDKARMSEEIRRPPGVRILIMTNWRVTGERQTDCLIGNSFHGIIAQVSP